MAQARVAAGAVLGTITDTAHAVSSVVNAVSGSLDMVNSFVRHQQEKQRFDQKLDLMDYHQRRIEEVSLIEGERRKKIADICKDPDLEGYYNQAFTRFSKLIPAEPETNP